MAYLTFHKWLVSVCNSHNDIWMVQTKTSHWWKVRFSDTLLFYQAIILLGWRYVEYYTWHNMPIIYILYNVWYIAKYLQTYTMNDLHNCLLICCCFSRLMLRGDHLYHHPKFPTSSLQIQLTHLHIIVSKIYTLHMKLIMYNIDSK